MTPRAFVDVANELLGDESGVEVRCHDASHGHLAVGKVRILYHIF